MNVEIAHFSLLVVFVRVYVFLLFFIRVSIVEIKAVEISNHNLFQTYTHKNKRRKEQNN